MSAPDRSAAKESVIKKGENVPSRTIHARQAVETVEDVLARVQVDALIQDRVHIHTVLDREHILQALTTAKIKRTMHIVATAMNNTTVKTTTVVNVIITKDTRLNVVEVVEAVKGHLIKDLAETNKVVALMEDGQKT